MMRRRKFSWFGLLYRLLVALVLVGGIAINIWYFTTVAGSDLPAWVKFLLLG